MLVTIQQLEDRMGRTLNNAQIRSGTAALDSLSTTAQFLAGRQWTTADVPQMVQVLILNAAERYLRNPDGFTASRAADEMVSWDSRGGPKPAEFNEKEEDWLKALGNSTQGQLHISYSPGYTAPTHEQNSEVDCCTSQGMDMAPFPWERWGRWSG